MGKPIFPKPMNPISMVFFSALYGFLPVSIFIEHFARDVEAVNACGRAHINGSHAFVLCRFRGVGYRQGTDASLPPPC
jgi:hypothetical protein